MSRAGQAALFSALSGTSTLGHIRPGQPSTEEMVISTLTLIYGVWENTRAPISVSKGGRDTGCSITKEGDLSDWIQCSHTKKTCRKSGREREKALSDSYRKLVKGYRQ